MLKPRIRVPAWGKWFYDFKVVRPDGWFMCVKLDDFTSPEEGWDAILAWNAGGKPPQKC